MREDMIQWFSKAGKVTSLPAPIQRMQRSGDTPWLATKCRGVGLHGVGGRICNSYWVQTVVGGWGSTGQQGARADGDTELPVPLNPGKNLNRCT